MSSSWGKTEKKEKKKPDSPRSWMGREKRKKEKQRKAKQRKKIYQKAVSFHCLQAELCVLSGLWLASCLVSETIDLPVTRSLSVRNKGRCWPLGGSLVTGLKSDNLLLQEALTFLFHAYPTTGAPLRSLWRWQLSLPSTPKQLPCGIKRDTTGAHFSLLELKRYHGSTFFFKVFIMMCGFWKKGKTSTETLRVEGSRLFQTRGIRL